MHHFWRIADLGRKRILLLDHNPELCQSDCSVAIGVVGFGLPCRGKAIVGGDVAFAQALAGPSGHGYQDGMKRGLLLREVLHLQDGFLGRVTGSAAHR